MKNKIKAKWVMKLPLEAKILVKLNDVVEEKQTIAVTEVKKIESFNFSSIFGKIRNEKLVGLNEKFRKVQVNEGDLICKTGGLFSSNKICFPISGDFLEIDEFGNLKIEIKQNEKKEVLAPVRSKVSKIEEGKIVLDFWAKEFKGEGLVEGKVWGNGEVKLINQFNQLGTQLDYKILFTDNLDSSFLLKAEVVGVVGIVTSLKNDDLKTKMPVIYLGNEIWQELFKNFSNGEYRFLLNSRLGRLLLVIE
ncbi:MAG: hypothetical protein PHX34_01920 [Candidatus Shapirobacteria bacterium]|nr:hypothetical protein [Candidatus Shapirobacteria bacterium]